MGVYLYFKMKKGQLQINETIMIVFIFVIIILAGLLIFYKFTLAGIKEDSIQNDIVRFQTMRATFSEIPEIKCSIQGMSESCVDSYKMIIFKKMTELDKDYYIFRFGFKDIQLKLVYPNKDVNNCSISNINNCGVWNLYSHIPKEYNKALKVDTPILVYFPDKEDYGISIVTITNYIVDKK